MTASAQPTTLHSPALHFLRRGAIVSLNNVAPERTLLQVLREDLCATGTKEGCAEGDCGACTVVVAQAEGDGLRFRAINSCIRLAHSVGGMALWTAEDIVGPGGALHPAQQAMLEEHGSQCGFCTPGFVMSLFAMYQNHVLRGHAITRELAQADLSGNLCRCTGYKPILAAAEAMAALPLAPLDTAELLQKLERLAHTSPAPTADSAYILPHSLTALLAARAAQPAAQLVAGCTDVGLWVTKQHRQFAQVLDVTRVAELRSIDQSERSELSGQSGQRLRIGAAVPLADAFAALAAQWPQLQHFGQRFAGLPVRNSGTLGGNVANGSPIGDSMPLLIALRASAVLMSVRGERALPLEAIYTGYRKNVLATDEVLAFIDVPLPAAATAQTSHLRAYKISKRYDDDISAVCLGLHLQVESGIITQASIGAGGVAATPVRALKTEAALAGMAWSSATLEQAALVLRQEFEPLSDLRASAAYRRQVLGNLLTRFWLECGGGQAVNLESFSLAEVPCVA